MAFHYWVVHEADTACLGSCWAYGSAERAKDMTGLADRKLPSLRAQTSSWAMRKDPDCDAQTAVEIELLLR